VLDAVRTDIVDRLRTKFQGVRAEARIARDCLFHQARQDLQDIQEHKQGSESGYDGVNVCSFCIDYLTVTASARNQLRALPVSKLKAYLKAFNIPNPGALEKDDIVQAVLDARDGPDRSNQTAVYLQQKRIIIVIILCLINVVVEANEGVSLIGLRMQPTLHGRRTKAPLVQAVCVPRNNHRVRLPNPLHKAVLDPSQLLQLLLPQGHRQDVLTHNIPPIRMRNPPLFLDLNHPGRRQHHDAQPPRPPTPIPSLSELLDRTPEQISALSVHVLKEILHQNHVNARLILEKSDLVDRVKMLIEDERREREREEELRRLEEEEAIEVQQRMMTEMRAREAARAAQAQAQQETPPMAAPEPLNENVQPENGEPPTVDVVDVDGPTREAADVSRPNSAPPAPAPVPAPIPLSTSPSKGLSSTAERSGLCVVCQDADANMALVDCG
ncbi:hypothetical protein FRB99_001553, partial [Tulasnella sp. 403]